MLSWDFNQKVGQAIYLNNEGKEWVYNLYQGNAYLIEVAEWEENGQNLYSVSKFALDKKHLETQIAEGDYNRRYAKLIRLTINKSVCHKAYEIAKLFGKVDGVTVEIK